MELQGEIKKIGSTASIGANNFLKRELVITMPDEKYPQHILVEFILDKCVILDKYQVGQEVKIGINIKGREWTNPQGEVKYFNSIQGWRIEPVNNNAQPTTATQLPNSAPPFPPAGKAQEVEEDLPF